MAEVIEKEGTQLEKNALGDWDVTTYRGVKMPSYARMDEMALEICLPSDEYHQAKGDDEHCTDDMCCLGHRLAESPILRKIYVKRTREIAEEYAKEGLLHATAGLQSVLALGFALGVKAAQESADGKLS